MALSAGFGLWRAAGGTSPVAFDSDGDGLGDGMEQGLVAPQIATTGLNQTNPEILSLTQIQPVVPIRGGPIPMGMGSTMASKTSMPMGYGRPQRQTRSSLIRIMMAWMMAGRRVIALQRNARRW